MDHNARDPALDTLEASAEHSLSGVERAPIGRNIAALLSSQLATWSLATILSIVQPRFLGPSSQGDFRLAFSLWTMASVVIGLGTAPFLTLRIAHIRATGLPLLGRALILRNLAFVTTLETESRVGQSVR